MDTNRDKASNIPEFGLKKEQEGDLPFKIEAIEQNVGYDPRSPHRHNYYEIFLFDSGGGLHMIDFNEMDIGEADVHFVSPRQIHFMHRKPESSGWVIKFSKEFYLAHVNDQNVLQRIPFLDNKVDAPRIDVERNEFNELVSLALRMREESERKEMGYQNMIHNYLNLVLMICHRQFNYSRNIAVTKENELIDRFKSLLEESFAEEHRVSFYSDQLGVSDDKLGQITKQMAGRTPSEMITTRLLLEAKRLLLHSNASIKEVAFQLNFQDNAYFNRWFKKLESSSPGAFREMSRKKYNR